MLTYAVMQYAGSTQPPTNYRVFLNTMNYYEDDNDIFDFK